MRRGFDSPLALCPPSEPRGVLFEPSHQGRRRSGRENIRGRHAEGDGFGGEESGPHFPVPRVHGAPEPLDGHGGV